MNNRKTKQRHHGSQGEILRCIGFKAFAFGISQTAFTKFIEIVFKNAELFGSAFFLEFNNPYQWRKK